MTGPLWLSHHTAAQEAGSKAGAEADGNAAGVRPPAARITSTGSGGLAPKALPLSSKASQPPAVAGGLFRRASRGKGAGGAGGVAAGGNGGAPAPGAAAGEACSPAALLAMVDRVRRCQPCGTDTDSNLVVRETPIRTTGTGSPLFL